MSKTTQRPVKELRIGSIKGAIWQNTVEGGVQYSITFSRIYRDGTEWRSAKNFGRQDLLTLAKLADQIHTALYQAEKDKTATASTPAGSDRPPRRD